MARATVLACDACGTWDSEDNPVRRVTVTGPKFELCEKDRARLLVGLGVPEDVAVEYTRLVNDKIGRTGALPPLSAARQLLTERQLADQGGQGNGNGVIAGLAQPQGDPNGDHDQTDILSALSPAQCTCTAEAGCPEDDNPCEVCRVLDPYGSCPNGVDTLMVDGDRDAEPAAGPVTTAVRSKRTTRGK